MPESVTPTPRAAWQAFACEAARRATAVTAARTTARPTPAGACRHGRGLRTIRPRGSRTQDADDYQCWSKSREEFARQMTTPGTQAAAQGWQRHYMRGTHPGTDRIVPGHQQRLHLRSFAEAPSRATATGTEGHGQEDQPSGALAALDSRRGPGAL
ncbi:DUF6065 family protein [Streptomyces sp. NPDC052396]|uniref:DUF6065 family protein n=1 Tax=Streptomyces sp. NPDC052396 TaxID=3365689 RepID=UPI0037D6C814